MAKRFLTPPNLPSGTANPASGEVGDLFYRTDLDQIQAYGSGGWAGLSGGGGSSVTVSDTAPSSPSEGDQWFNSATGQIFVYYDSFWVEIISNTEVQTLPIANVTGLQTELNSKADIATLPGKTSLSGTLLSHSAERSNFVTIGQHYAFGNGSSDSAMAVPANCKLVMATLALDPSSVSDTSITVVVGKNNITQGSYTITASGSGGSGVQDYYSSPLQFAAGDLLHWEASATSGGGGGSVVSWYLLVD